MKKLQPCSIHLSIFNLTRLKGISNHENMDNTIWNDFWYSPKCTCREASRIQRTILRMVSGHPKKVYAQPFAGPSEPGDIGDKSLVLFENLFSKSYKMSWCFLSLWSKFPVLLKTFRRAWLFDTFFCIVEMF